MASTIVMINLFGAVALLLFGLRQVKDGVTLAFGSRLRAGLAKGTRNGWRSFLSGFAATIALQSSTATALLTASFAEKRMVEPRMAQIVLLGANVGTAVTAWIVAAGVEWLAPLAILSGMVLFRSQAMARRGGGMALIGIGLMLTSLHLLSAATEPMRESPALAAFFALLSNAWPVALALAAGVAFISSSSLAAVVLILSLAATGALPLSLIIVLVLGANLGGAIPPVIASLSGPASVRRITLGNLLVRAVGCIIALPLAGFAGEIMSSLPLAPEKLPVDAHLSFNILLAILAAPFATALSTLMTRLIRDDEKEESGPRFLDEQELQTPVVALASATREVLAVGDLIERMLARISEALERNDTGPLADVPALEKRVDMLQQAVKIYLSKLKGDRLDDEQSRRSIVIIDYAINLEHIGDIIEKGLREQVAKKIDNHLRFSEAGYAELRNFLALTIDNLRIAQTIFVTRDFGLARQLMEIKVEVRRIEKESSERHLDRLRSGSLESLQTSSLHLDMLRDLKRVNAHIVSVAHPILEEGGLLGETRLIKSAH